MITPEQRQRAVEELTRCWTIERPEDADNEDYGVWLQEKWIEQWGKLQLLESANKRLEEELREAKDEIRMLLANRRADDIRFTRYREAIEPARLALSRFNEKKMREGYHVALQEHAEDLFHILSRLTDLTKEHE